KSSPSPGTRGPPSPRRPAPSVAGMGPHTGAGRPHRNRPGTHRRSGQALIARRDHSAPPRSRRPAIPSPSPSALVGLAVLVLIAVGAVHLSGAGSAIPLQPAPSSPAPAAADESAAPSSAPPTADSGTAPATADEPSPEIVVHVSGAVASPGVVRLPREARVDDALHAVGGPTEEADLAAVNLARPLVDGEQIHVPVPGEEPREQ